ncbi:regulator of chromosome condensation (RCC1) repeat-containing protein [Cryptosporidium felis]|nr:regulator of chromosome condensation (RCC1) repeat-containing protein [Cryptosporidium felis]
MYSNVQQQSTKNEYLITTSDYLLDLKRPVNKKTIVSIYRGKNEIETIHTLGKKKVIQVSSGLNHVLFLTSDLEVYSYGTGMFGQLGHGEKIQKLKEPKRIEGLQGIIKISSGTYFSMGLTEEGALYRWGLYDSMSPAEFFPKLESLFGEKNQKVVEISSYKERACLALETGEIYAWDFHNPRMELVCKLTGAVVRQISMGAYFALVLDSSFQLFVWGDNTFGEFGDRDIVAYDPDFPDFYKLDIESWGLSTKNLASKDKKTVEGLGKVGIEYCKSTPNHPKDVYIERISCGEKHSLILTSDNTILCLGDNTYGQCGIFDEKKTIYPPVTLKKFSNLDLFKPYISCGTRSSGIISPTGKLFLCGQIFEDSNSSKKVGVSKYVDRKENLNRLSAEYSIIHRNSLIVEFSENSFIAVSN